MIRYLRGHLLAVPLHHPLPRKLLFSSGRNDDPRPGGEALNQPPHQIPLQTHQEHGLLCSLVVLYHVSRLLEAQWVCGYLWRSEALSCSWTPAAKGVLCSRGVGMIGKMTVWLRKHKWTTEKTNIFQHHINAGWLSAIKQKVHLWRDTRN